MTTGSNIDDVPPFGAAMMALPSDRMRSFVVNMYADDAPTDGLLRYAAREAGYAGSDAVLSVTASRLVRDPRIRQAMLEYSQSIVIQPQAVRAVKQVLGDSTHRDFARVIGMILDRTEPVEMRHTVKVEDNRPPSPEAIEHVLKRIDELARRAGLALPAPIDGEFVVVEPGA